MRINLEIRRSLGFDGAGARVKKPVDLAYGVDERPPIVVSGIVAIQHVGVICVNLVYALLLAREAGLSADVTGDILRIGMFALGLGVLIQAVPVGRFGCHYLAPWSTRALISRLAFSPSRPAVCRCSGG